MIKNDKPLSNLQIDNYYKDNPLYRSSVYLSDIKQIEPDTFTIALIDLLPDDDVMGHWILLFDTGDTLITYNSFGNPPTHDMRRLAGHRLLLYNSVPSQNPTSALCGFYTIFIADLLLSGMPFREALDSLPKLYGNKNTLIKHF